MPPNPLPVGIPAIVVVDGQIENPLGDAVPLAVELESALAVRHGTASTTLDPARVETFTRGVRVRVERASLTA